MRIREARKLAIGDKVYWATNLDDWGVVRDVGYSGVTVEWMNVPTGQTSTGKTTCHSQYRFDENMDLWEHITRLPDG